MENRKNLHKGYGGSSRDYDSLDQRNRHLRKNVVGKQVQKVRGRLEGGARGIA